MNKELGRKITSLTLMTIMLTWSAAMGFSSTFMPEAEAANEHLYVSAEAEGSFNNAQVIEIVVSESHQLLILILLTVCRTYLSTGHPSSWRKLSMVHGMPTLQTQTLPT